VVGNQEYDNVGVICELGLQPQATGAEGRSVGVFAKRPSFHGFNQVDNGRERWRSGFGEVVSDEGWFCGIGAVEVL
jgi:hypothetical protein